jgi:uncharacterized protein (DUF111 family)
MSKKGERPESAKSAHLHDHDHENGRGHHAKQGRQRHAGGKPGSILTVRAVSGLSGDMILAGLATMAGLTGEETAVLIKELRLPALEGALSVEARTVNQVAGVGCRIDLPHEHAHRTLADIRAIIMGSCMPDEAKELSLKAFTILANAEGAVHGQTAESVTFHEVGALDSILDTCLSCRVFTLLSPSRFICSPLPLADGAIRCAHGLMPSPAPAVLRMLEGVPVRGFSGEGETVTPTALSLLKALDADFGPWPSVTVRKTVISYGGKVFENAPNGAVWALCGPS